VVPPEAVEPEPRARQVERAFALPVIIAALLVVPVMAVQDSAGASPTLRDAADLADLVLWSVFAVELVATTAVARRRARWLATHPLEVLIVVASAPLLPAAFGTLRVLRLVRLLRLLRVAKAARVAFSPVGVRYAALLAAVTALGAGEAFAMLEGTSVGEGVYWALSTMTTVGYGDLSPATEAGRMIAIGVMLVGIGLVAILTGAVAERFVLRSSDDDAAPTHGDLVVAVERLSAEVAALREARADHEPPGHGPS
jgi:voltage-gated potassium channel